MRNTAVRSRHAIRFSLSLLISKPPRSASCTSLPCHTCGCSWANTPCIQMNQNQDSRFSRQRREDAGGCASICACGMGEVLRRGGSGSGARRNSGARREPDRCQEPEPPAANAAFAAESEQVRRRAGGHAQEAQKYGARGPGRGGKKGRRQRLVCGALTGRRPARRARPHPRWELLVAG